MYFFYRVTRPWQPQPSVCGINDAFLYFVLPFVSAESGPTKLTGLLRQRPLPQPLANDPTMEVSIKSMSPWSLNFQLKPPEGRGQSFSHNLLLNIPPKGLPYYQLLVELEPDIGPLIARLALHLIDVAATTCVSTVSMLNPHVGTFATAKALASSVFMADRHQIPHAPNVNKVQEHLQTINQPMVCQQRRSCRTERSVSWNQLQEKPHNTSVPWNELQQRTKTHPRRSTNIKNRVDVRDLSSVQPGSRTTSCDSPPPL